jgi:tetratricopeptide (TPR) repeat protein
VDRRSLYSVVVLLALAGATPAAGQAALDDCAGHKDPDRRIAVCTRLVHEQKETVQVRTLAYFHRANAHQSKGEYERAIADFTAALRLDPKFRDAWSGRGFAYGDKGAIEHAIADLSEALRIAPGAQEYESRGFLNDQLSELDAAIADYTQAIKLEPESAYTYFLRGIAYDKMQAFDHALADFSRAVELDPGFAKAYYHRGALVSYAKGDLLTAIEDYERALQVDPNFADARRDLEDARREVEVRLKKLAPVQKRP